MIALGGTIGIGLVIGTGTALRQGWCGSIRSSRSVSTLHRWPTWHLSRLLLCRCVPPYMDHNLSLIENLPQGVSGAPQYGVPVNPANRRSAAIVSCKASERYNLLH